jgi:hypothetical protein
MIASNIDTTTVTERQMSMVHRITNETTGETFYIAESASEPGKEYHVKALLKGNHYFLTCSCPAVGQCWHQRAAAAAAKEFKAAQKAQAKAEAPVLLNPDVPYLTISGQVADPETVREIVNRPAKAIKPMTKADRRREEINNRPFSILR